MGLGHAAMLLRIPIWLQRRIVIKIMRILVTGASSPLAVGVLRQLLLNSDLELWCGRHRKDIPIADPRLHVIDLDLESDLSGTLSRSSLIWSFTLRE